MKTRIHPSPVSDYGWHEQAWLRGLSVRDFEFGQCPNTGGDLPDYIPPRTCTHDDFLSSYDNRHELNACPLVTDNKRDWGAAVGMLVIAMPLIGCAVLLYVRWAR